MRNAAALAVFMGLLGSALPSRGAECPNGALPAPLPAPTGRFAVGTLVLPPATAGSSTRQVQLWYPVRKARSRHDGATVPYVPSDELATLRARKFENQPECVFDAWAQLRTSAHAGAPIDASGSRFPLVMIAPGLGLPRLLYTVYAQQLASDGYIVATFDFQHGGFLADDDEDAPAIVADWAKHFSSFIDSAASIELLSRADLTRIAAVGHSIGGAAALEACRNDKRIRACVDMDGLPFGPVANEGIRTRALWLRSQPDYSDADLARLHRTRAAWDAMREKTKAEVSSVVPESGGAAWILSIRQTAHMSFSDAPFTMPSELTHFGGTFLDRSRFFAVTTQLIEDYCQWSFGARKVFPPSPLAPEVTVQLARRE